LQLIYLLLPSIVV